MSSWQRLILIDLALMASISLVGALLYLVLGWPIIPGLIVLLVILPGLAFAVWLFIYQNPWLKASTSTLTVANVPITLVPVWSLIQGSTSAPIWLVFALGCWAAAVYCMRYDYLQYRSWYRQQNELCIHCGYNLIATEKRCPECGTPVPEQHDRYRSPKIASLAPKVEGPSRDRPFI